MSHAIRALILFLSLALPARAETRIGLAINESDGVTYDQALELAAEAGFSLTSLTVFWDEMVPDAITYAPEMDWPLIAGAFYPATGFQVSLVLPVIDTVTDRRPLALQEMAWDDPVLLDAFKVYAEGVLSRLGNVDIASIAIGNEVDAYLTRTSEWADYGAFLDGAAAIVRDLRPDVPVSVTLTWGGLNGAAQDAAHALGGQEDIWLITYYPLRPDFSVEDPEAAISAIAAMVDLAGGAPLAIAEAGYPSGGCGATEDLQVAFVEVLLGALADYDGQIASATLVWMHDIGPDELAGYLDYYGSDDPCFASYLATLGLRTADGVNKPAFDLLQFQGGP